MEQKDNKFTYNYAAPTERERRMAAHIREGYLPQAIDRKPRGERTNSSLPMVVALTLGIVGTLLFGGGLALILEAGRLGWGSLFCVVGIAPVVAAYPVYAYLFRRQEKRRKEQKSALTKD